MARKGREKSSINVYHILLRGMKSLFESENDYQEFYEILERYVKSGQIGIIAYALLKNRIHLIVEAQDVGLALKPICTAYARYFNRTHASSGKLFYDRFKSEPINSEAQIKSAIAFINAVAEYEECEYCSLRLSDFCEFEKRKIKKSEFLSLKITEMYIEDFDGMSREQIGRFIYDLCGILPKDFKKLPKQEQNMAMDVLTQKRWIAGTKLSEILGVKKERAKMKKTVQDKDVPKAEEQPSVRKEELSVWLL